MSSKAAMGVALLLLYSALLCAWFQSAVGVAFCGLLIWMALG
jgi:hypothetical protein